MVSHSPSQVPSQTPISLALRVSLRFISVLLFSPITLRRMSALHWFGPIHSYKICLGSPSVSGEYLHFQIEITKAEEHFVSYDDEDTECNSWC